MAVCWTLEPAAALDFVQNRDVMLGARQDQANFELVVNVGQLSDFLDADPGAVVPLPQLSAGSLSYAFGSYDGLRWSVSASIVGAASEVRPRNTVWVTRPRAELGERTEPWIREKLLSQGGEAVSISSIGANAASYSDQNPADPVSNSDTAVVIPAGHMLSYSLQMGPGGNLKGYFQGVVENVTPVEFVSLQGVSRSDFYELEPSDSSEPAKYLGYFDLRWDGTLTFTAAGGTTPVAPVIDSIAPGAEGIEIGFRSTSGVSYFLRSTDSSGLGSPVGDWPPLPDTIVGDGGPRKFVVPLDGRPSGFYVLEAR